MSRPLFVIILAVLVVDLVLVGAHVTYSSAATDIRGDLRIRLDKDQGFGELFAAGKLVVASLLLIHTWWRRHASAALAWSVSLLLIVVDDLGRLHEDLAKDLPLLGSVGAGSQQIGEIVAFAILGLIVFALVSVGHRRDDHGSRAWSWSMASALALLVVAGMGLDLVHGLSTPGTNIEKALTIAEDGGELLAITLLLATAAAWHRSSA